MSAMITSITTQPVVHNPHVYGGDDSTYSYKGFFGHLVAWEKNPSNSCCPSAVKAWILFFVDKTFEFLDWARIGHAICNKGLVETKREYQFLQDGAERNRVAREQVIEALGGAQACNGIPVVSLALEELQPRLSINDRYFANGQWIIQGEDPAGRKFIALRLIERATRAIHIVTIHQAYRETSWNSSQDGQYWKTNDSSAQNSLGHTSLDYCVGLIRDLWERGSRNHFRVEGPISSTRLERSTFDQAPKT